MKLGALSLVILLTCAACGSLPLIDTESSATPPAAKVKHYRAWCKEERKFLGDWETDRAKAEALRTHHNKLYPHHLMLIQTVER